MLSSARTDGKAHARRQQRRYRVARCRTSDAGALGAGHDRHQDERHAHRPGQRSRPGSVACSTSRARRSPRRATSGRAPGPTTASGAHPLLECSFPLLSIFGANALTDMAQAAAAATTRRTSDGRGARGGQSAAVGAHHAGSSTATGISGPTARALHATYANYAYPRSPPWRQSASTTRMCSSSGTSPGDSPTPRHRPACAYDGDEQPPGGVDVISMISIRRTFRSTTTGYKSTWALASGVTIDLDRMVAFAQTTASRSRSASAHGAGSSSSNGEQRRGARRRHVDRGFHRVDERAAARALLRDRMER